MRMVMCILLAVLPQVDPKKKAGLNLTRSDKMLSINESYGKNQVDRKDLKAVKENETALVDGFISYTFIPHYQTQSPENGNNVRPTTIGDADSFEETNKNLRFTRQSRHISKRYYVHHSNDKYLVAGYQRRQFPYSNVVRLSLGCTGTLLTPAHVLTAAHCVHDGKDFKENIEMLKVEVPDKIGYRLHYITTIRISANWIKSQALPEAAKGAYDYAILELNLPVRRRSRFMQLSVPDVNKIGSNIYFFGFFSSESSEMWESSCKTDDGLVIMHQNVILAECDSVSGNSGAAVFTENARDGQNIIGVLSNIISASANEEETEYSAIMLLTLSKALDICAMIYPEAEKYDICSRVKRQNTEHLNEPKRRMPLFGR